jgi:hypothetical protein
MWIDGVPLWWLILAPGLLLVLLTAIIDLSLRNTKWDEV